MAVGRTVIHCDEVMVSLGEVRFGQNHHVFESTLQNKIKLNLL